MRIKATIAAVMLVVAVLAAGAVVVADIGNTPSRLLWENEDGTMDVSKLPATRPVVDRMGQTVGTISTDYMKTGDRDFPLPVTGPDGQLIGHIGPNGYWAIGESEPEITDSVTTIEEVGNLNSVQ